MRLPLSLRAGFYGCGGLLVASGLVWLGVHYAAAPGAGGSAAALEVHGAAAMAILFLAGAVAALHVPCKWRERKNRSSGIAITLFLGVLTISGFFLYYAGDDRVRETASIVHWIVGLAAPILLWLHSSLGRRDSRP